MGYQGSSQSSQSSSYNWSESLSEYFSNAFSQNSSSSQNSSQSGTSESRLSTQQADILESREKLFNSYYFPELQSAIEETKQGSAANRANMELASNAVNTAFDASRKATQQSIAQQGLAGSRTGVEAALTAANNRARSSALAQAYFNQLSQSQNNKTALLQTMGSLMPSPTNSAEYYSSATSQGTSTSSGTSESVSGGQSKSKSEGSTSSSGSARSLGIGI